jgi:hypothetical protein
LASRGRSNRFGRDPCCLVAYRPWRTWHRPILFGPVIKENFDRIHVGMTAKEVEAILGKPEEGITGEGWNIWEGPGCRCSISVWYKDGKVDGKGGGGF